MSKLQHTDTFENIVLLFCNIS